MELKTQDVVDKIRAMKVEYITQSIGSDPARLPQHLAEFLGYATLLYEHYAEILKRYRLKEAEVTKSEHNERDEANKLAERPSDKVTITEVQQRIEVRLSNLKAERDYLEVEVRGVTLHINGIQSLMKNWDSEAKGIR